LGREFGFQDQGVGAIAPFRRSCVTTDLPPAVPRLAEERGEARRRVEARQAQPVDRPVAADQRGALAVADQGVVLDPRVRHLLSGPPRGRDSFESVSRRPGEELVHPDHEPPSADGKHRPDPRHQHREEPPAARRVGLGLLLCGRRCGATDHWPAMAGSRWAMPLWQSMQVLSPAASEPEWASAPRLLWRVKSMAWNSWQLR